MPFKLKTDRYIKDVTGEQFTSQGLIRLYVRKIHRDNNTTYM